MIRPGSNGFSIITFSAPAVAPARVPGCTFRPDGATFPAAPVRAAVKRGGNHGCDALRGESRRRAAGAPEGRGAEARADAALAGGRRSDGEGKGGTVRVEH